MIDRVCSLGWQETKGPEQRRSTGQGEDGVLAVDGRGRRMGSSPRVGGDRGPNHGWEGTGSVPWVRGDEGPSHG